MVHGGLGEFAVVEIRESLPAREVLNLDIISIFLLIYFRFTAIIVWGNVLLYSLASLRREKFRRQRLVFGSC